jgi:hypothetical protein
MNLYRYHSTPDILDGYKPILLVKDIISDDNFDEIRDRLPDLTPDIVADLKAWVPVTAKDMIKYYWMTAGPLTPRLMISMNGDSVRIFNNLRSMVSTNGLDLDNAIVSGLVEFAKKLPTVLKERDFNSIRFAIPLPGYIIKNKIDFAESVKVIQDRINTLKNSNSDVNAIDNLQDVIDQLQK